MNIAVMKEYNIRRHYDKDLEGIGKGKINNLKHSLVSQRNIFKKPNVHGELIVLATYTVVEVTVKDECPFTGSEILLFLNHS
jgi:hypothetical protein